MTACMCLLLCFAEGSEEQAFKLVPWDLNNLTFIKSLKRYAHLVLCVPRKHVLLHCFSSLRSRWLSLNISFFIGSDGHVRVDAEWAAGCGWWLDRAGRNVQEGGEMVAQGCCALANSVLQRTKSRFRTVILTWCWQTHPWQPAQFQKCLLLIPLLFIWRTFQTLSLFPNKMM